jgi:hypothetical protein
MGRSSTGLVRPSREAGRCAFSCDDSSKSGTILDRQFLPSPPIIRPEVPKDKLRHEVLYGGSCARYGNDSHLDYYFSSSEVERVQAEIDIYSSIPPVKNAVPLLPKVLEESALALF